MIESPSIIIGGKHADERGEISFVNGFDMAQVRRFYKIKHLDTTTVRGWRAHRIEQRWFHVYSGSFIVNLVEIDNWDLPNKNAIQFNFHLNAADFSVLHIPVGYASSIKAMTKDSEMIVFGDYPIEHASMDNYLFPADYFKPSQNLSNEN
jgi:dTDP-4-dehydrorhamnose 3,5-epimerase